MKLNIADHLMKYDEFDHYLPHRDAVQEFFGEPRYSMINKIIFIYKKYY